LLEKYPDNWLIDVNKKEEQGNVLNLQNQMFWKHFFSSISLNLYTSDLGNPFYETQEKEHILPHIGQIVTGLLNLTSGGTMIVKQYTFFHILSKQIIFLLTGLFENVTICKPSTSKISNSENYLVCENYTDNKEIKSKIIELFIYKIKNKNEPTNYNPFFSKIHFPKNFLNLLKEVEKDLFEKQILWLYVRSCKNFIGEIIHEKFPKENLPLINGRLDCKKFIYLKSEKATNLFIEKIKFLL
jgi:hypothetical protein